MSQLRATKAAVNAIHPSYRTFDATGHRIALWGDEALLKNDSVETIYVCTETNNDQQPYADCLAIMPGQHLRVPLPGQESGTGTLSDVEIAAAAFDPTVKLSVWFNYS